MTKSENLEEKQTLTDWLRDNTHGVVDPMVMFLAKIGVTANMLTVFGLLIHLPVAYFLAIGEWRVASLLGILSIMDSLDGALARHQNTSHNGAGFGAFFDSTVDRVSELILFGGLIYYFSSQGDPNFTIVSYLALGGSLMVSYTRARAESLGYSNKVGFFSRIERYLVLFVFGMAQLPQIGVSVLAIGTWLTAIQRFINVRRQAK